MFERIQDKNTLKILTPGLKNRNTAKIKLSNGLQAYLISDPDADKSAAGLAMQVGSWQDPKKYPGMAHFCEHLLFLATKTYPKEDHFQSSVKDHGGMSNAYTAEDRTVYIFTANHKAFANILDQFAHFFIDPAFNPSGVERELHAVDQESDMYYENDSWRSWMVFKEMGNPNHPNALFNIGNGKTLSKIPVVEVKNWFQTHYTAHKARLVLYSPHPIQKLTQMAISYFSNIPSHTTTTNTSPHLSTISSAAQKGHITYIKPIKDKRTLTLTWELPATYSDIANKVPSLIAHTINSKTSNSLYSQLKKEGIAENIHSGIYHIARVPFIYIHITFVKNEKLLPLHLAINRCFQTISVLQSTGIPRYLFEEMRLQNQTKYSYQERANAFEFVERCASELIDEPLATYPLQTVLPTEYRASEYKDLLDILTPSRCIFKVMAPAKYTGMVYDKKEKWYGAEYNLYAIPKHKLDAWQNMRKHPNIGLPNKNPFIPTNLTLKHRAQATAPSAKPLFLENSTQGKAFFYPDTSYQTPQIAWRFQVKTPLIHASPKQQILIHLYIKNLKEAFANESQQAEEAGLHCDFYQEDFKLYFKIHGYNDKASLLLEALLNKLTAYLPSKEQFDIHRASLARSYLNYSKSEPYNHALDMYGQLFTNYYRPDYEVCLAILPNISYGEFCTFIKKLFEKTYVEAFFSGNLTKQEAVDNWYTIKTKLVQHPYPIPEHHVKKLLVLPKDSGPYKISKKISMQGHATVVLLQAGDFSFEKNAMMQVLDKAFKDGYFTTLRTKQQIAYLAWSWGYERCGQLLQTFCIQSSTHTPQELLIRTEAFVEDYVKDFTAHLSQDRFEAIRTQLIISLRTPPPNLMGMCDQLIKFAFEYDGDFDRIDKEVNALKNITYAQVKAFAIDLASRQNYRRAAFLVEGTAPQGKDFQYEAIGSDDLKSIGTYVQKKKSSKL